MLIIKKKYVVKIATFISALIVIVAFFFVRVDSIDRKVRQNENKMNISILTNVCASVESISNSFKKANDLNDFALQSKDIYSDAKSAKNILCLSDKNNEKAILWFSDLSQYAQTDMNDSDKNKYYTNKISDAKTILMNICTNYDPASSFLQLNDFFSDENKSSDKNKELCILEKQYSMLENNVIADRKDLCVFAKEILGLNYYPSQFKGNYIFPKAVSYSSNNSYVNIFQSGKTLLNMSALHNDYTTNDNSTNVASSTYYLNKYAPYAKNCKEVFKIKRDSISYCIYCPVLIENEEEIINYDESIKTAISEETYSLKAFDASAYLKNHPVKVSSSLPEKNTEINFGNNSSIISSKFIIHNGEYCTEYKLVTSDNNIYYYIIEKNKTKTLNEKDYIKYLGLT